MYSQRLQATQTQTSSCREPSKITIRDGIKTTRAMQRALYQLTNLATSVKQVP